MNPNLPSHNFFWEGGGQLVHRLMVHSHWLSPGLGQGLGKGTRGMGCMVLCRTFHTAPYQGQEPEQGQVKMGYVAILPPANEVWGKLMFSHVFVCPWGVGFPVCITGHVIRRVCIQGVCLQGGLHSGGSASRGSASRGSASRGVCIQEGLHPGGLPPGGSAFRRVCIQGVCLQGGLHSGGSASRGSASRGYCLQGDTAFRRVCIQGVCLQGVCIWEGSAS